MHVQLLHARRSTAAGAPADPADQPDLVLRRPRHDQPRSRRRLQLLQDVLLQGIRERLRHDHRLSRWSAASTASALRRRALKRRLKSNPALWSRRKPLRRLLKRKLKSLDYYARPRAPASGDDGGGVDAPVAIADIREPCCHEVLVGRLQRRDRCHSGAINTARGAMSAMRASRLSGAVPASMHEEIVGTRQRFDRRQRTPATPGRPRRVPRGHAPPTRCSSRQPVAGDGVADRCLRRADIGKPGRPRIARHDRKAGHGAPGAVDRNRRSTFAVLLSARANVSAASVVSPTGDAEYG